MQPETHRLTHSIYGRQSSWEEAALALIAVPWEGGVSFRRGTAQAPELIRQVSAQIDYYRSECPLIEEIGIAWIEPSRPFSEGSSKDSIYETEVLPYVRLHVEAALRAQKRFGIIGGDHSVPLGAHYALATEKPYGVLHIDAHADLRSSYEGMSFSHATILYHISQLKHVERIVAVGVRDWAREEAEYARSLYPRLAVYEMRRLAHGYLRGRPFTETVSEIVSLLPPRVYVSIDVDALEVGYTPHTGTPVPGGLRYEELFFLLEAVPRSGRTIIGFDVCETGGAELDAVVAAHLIYRLCAIALCGTDSGA
ncbi:MAG: arginase family protein [Bacteroidia bacterium]|nr:arginase family protein [Bacteroidia bacterium]MCX7763546.1 arginase family protein [Bacteroidia bacterium]MDW8058371.1 arginase family protein [Bacteroidia bacterium]